jgi:hypothetical protein
MNKFMLSLLVVLVGVSSTQAEWVERFDLAQTYKATADVSVYAVHVDEGVERITLTCNGQTVQLVTKASGRLAVRKVLQLIDGKPTEVRDNVIAVWATLNRLDCNK